MNLIYKCVCCTYLYIVRDVTDIGTGTQDWFQTLFGQVSQIGMVKTVEKCTKQFNNRLKI